jgi:methanogenic corrinoid protein MtbC1
MVTPQVMERDGNFVASILEASARALAAGALQRLPDSADGPTAVELWGFADALADAELRLRSLANALAVGRPELFALDVQWLREVHAARGLEPQVLDSTLRALRAELEESLPAGARELAGRYLALGERAAGEQTAAPAPAGGAAAAQEPHAALARTLLEHLIEGRRREAEELVLGALDGGLGLGPLHDQVIGAAQRELGQRWQAGTMDVATEHHVSRSIQDLLVLLRARASGPRAPAAAAGRVIVASVAGNLHDIGARMVADHFELAGFETRFLGADTPAADLARAAEAFGADLLALSVGRGADVRSAARAIDAVRAACPELPVLVGGAPFQAIEGLWRDVGADACAADAEGAVREARRLLG